MIHKCVIEDGSAYSEKGRKQIALTGQVSCFA